MTDATDKRKQSMLKKYGSPEAVAAVYRAAQKKSRQNPNTRKGGFSYLKANDPDKLSELSRQAAFKRHASQKTAPIEDTPQD